MGRSAGAVLLETERLVLRHFTMSDAGNLADLDADPDVMRFITGGLATSREEIQDNLLPGFMAWYRRPGGYGCWAAEEKSTGAFLGWFRFHPRRAGPSGEIVLGYRLLKSAWGKGYATEGSCALIRKGFTGVHSRGAGNWRQLMAGSGGSQGLPAMALAMVSSAVMPWAAAESR
jgi:RimJ/RimL family protein N-acetyltransferase